MARGLSCIFLLAGIVAPLVSQEGQFAEYTQLQEEVLKKLTGAMPIKDNLKLSDRASQANRKESAEYIKQVWKDQGLDTQCHAYPGGENVYGVVKSLDNSEEYVVVGAHYDTVPRCPGANDNGSGVAVVTALVAEFIKNPPRSRHIMFVAFDQEEVGMKGSKAFAQKLKRDGIKVNSVHTYDQVAWDSNNNLAVELEIPYSGAKALYEKVGKTMPAPVPIIVTKESGSDHNAFRKLGFAAVGLTEEYRSGDTTPHMHKASDKIGTVNFPYLESTTQLAMGVLKVLTQ